MSIRYPVAGMPPLLFLLISFLLCACGGVGDIPSGMEQQFPSATPTMLRSVGLHELQRELGSLPVPPGVDPSVFRDLRRELSSVLAAAGSQRVTSTAPQGGRNRIADLTLVLDAAPEARLEWTYVNLGDYDQNGEANLADLTPIGLHFGKTEADPDWEQARLADGDGNGEVNIADITPLGNNFLAQVASYTVLGGYTADGPWEELGSLAISEGSADPRLRFSFSMPADDYPIYRVLPLDAGGEAGQGGITEGTLPGPFNGILQMTPGSGVSGSMVDVDFSIPLSGLAIDAGSLELLEVDGGGNLVQGLGSPVDDGSMGDAEAGDLLYSLATQIDADQQGERFFRLEITYNDGERERTVSSNTVRFITADGVEPLRAQEIIDHMQAVQAELETLSGQIPRGDAALQVLEQLEQDPMAVDPALTGDAEGVSWLTAEGFQVVASILGGTPGSATSSTADGELPGAQALPRGSSDAGATQQKAPKNYDVLAYRPFLNAPPDLKLTDDLDEIILILGASTCPEFRTASFNDSDASIYLLGKFRDYGIILISTYSMIYYPDRDVDELQVDLLTGIDVNASNLPSYTNLMMAFSDIRRFLTIHAKGYYCFTPHLLSEAFPAGKHVLYVCAANSSHKSLRNASAIYWINQTAYFGYQNIVTPRQPFGQKSGMEIFSRMLNGMKASEAYDDLFKDSLTGIAQLRLHGGESLQFGTHGYVICEVPSLGPSFVNPSQPSFSRALDVNNRSQVVGESSDPEGNRTGFIWDKGSNRITRIDTLGGSLGKATAINDLGQVTGWSINFLGDRQAFLYENGKTSGLAGLGNYGEGADINNSGLIAGITDIIGDPNLYGHPCAYIGGDTIDLGVFGSGTPSSSSPENGYALSVSESGRIVGVTTDYEQGGLHGFLAFPGEDLARMPYELSYLGEAQTEYYSSCRAIDATGNIVVGADWVSEVLPGPGTTVNVFQYGSKYVQGNLKPLFYKVGNDWWAPQGFDPGKRIYEVEGLAISLDGTVVGRVGSRLSSNEAYAYRAFIIRPLEQPRWLDELIPCGSGWTLESANAINVHGEIVGVGRYKGNTRGFIMYEAWP